MTKKQKNGSEVRVLNKRGRFVSYVPRNVAIFSVNKDKSVWVNDSTIQIVYDKSDEFRFKQEVWERDNYTCYVCGIKLHKGHPDLTVDHVESKSSGGSILPKNMQSCCRFCNEQKGWRSYKQYFWHLYAALAFVVLWEGRRTGGGYSRDSSEQKEEKEKAESGVSIQGRYRKRRTRTG